MAKYENSDVFEEDSKDDVIVEMKIKVEHEEKITADEEKLLQALQAKKNKSKEKNDLLKEIEQLKKELKEAKATKNKEVIEEKKEELKEKIKEKTIEKPKKKEVEPKVENKQPKQQERIIVDKHTSNNMSGRNLSKLMKLLN